MIFYAHLRDLIKDTLTELAHEVNNPNIANPAAVELLMLTAAVESNGGSYLKQWGDGPARGIFQMEPSTEKSLHKHYLSYRDKLNKAVLKFDSPADNDLMVNLAYQIVMARIKYLLVKEELPKVGDIRGLGKYWKKYYNTEKGKGKAEEAITKYIKYINGEII